MPFKAAKCPNCAGDIQVPDDRDSVKCMYCGSDIVVREAIKLAGAEINLENILKLADEAMNSENYAEAYNYYTKILEIDPNNYKAWYGKAISAGWQSSLANLRIGEILNGIEKAINLAPDNEKNELKINVATSLNQLVNAYYNSAEKSFRLGFESHNFSYEIKAKQEFKLRMQLLLSVLELASIYDTNNITTLKNIVFITQEYVSYKVELDDDYEKNYVDAVDKIKEVTKKIQQFEPEYKAVIPLNQINQKKLWDDAVNMNQSLSQKSACFIATAAYDSPMATEVVVLREYRNRYLQNTILGKMFVDLYYHISPPIAKTISKSKVLKTITKLLLKPVISLIKRYRIDS